MTCKEAKKNGSQSGEKAGNRNYDSELFSFWLKTVSEELQMLTY